MPVKHGFKRGHWRVPKEEVYKLFTINNLIPLGEYVGATKKIPYLCLKHLDKGVQHKSYDSLKQGSKGCEYCAREKRASKLRIWNTDKVRELVESRGCVLISTDVKSIDDIIDYICFCGNPYSKTVYEFKINAYTCYECEMNARKVRENHWNWQGGVTPENEIFRKSKKYIKWRDSVYERDNYTCQCCLKQGFTLNAHHIDNFATNEDKRLEIDNGITLCEDCHMQGKPNSFHTRYKQFDNNAEQLIEYINIRRKELNIHIPFTLNINT